MQLKSSVFNQNQNYSSPMSTKMKYSIVLAITFLIGIYVCNVHRDYIYENNLDSVLADMGANLFCVPFMCYLWWATGFKPTQSKVLDVTALTLVYVVNEVFTYFSPDFGTFDMLDIWGLIIGAVVTLIILRLIDDNDFQLAYINYKNFFSKNITLNG
jgi:hypothetical protein